MCYHTKSPTKEYLRKIVEPTIKILDYPELPFANGFDHPQLPVILNSDPDTIQPVIWDFTPPVNKFLFTTLNAKCETVFSSPLFGESAKNRRCLVFLQGMYEWSPLGGIKTKKKPYYIDRIDKLPFAVGGIWKDWGNNRVTCSIITTPANNLMTELRPEVPRMLFIAKSDIWDTWLNPGSTQQQLTDIMKPFRDGELQYTALDKSPLSKSKG